VPVEETSSRFRMRLSMPRAWDTELLLRVPQEQALAEVSGGALIDARQTGEGFTSFKVLGLNGDLTVSWWAPRDSEADAPTVLEATGFILERIDGRSVHSEAKLTVSSFGGLFNQFRVRLPAGCALLTGDQPEYSLTLVAPEAESSDRAAREVEVRLRSPTAGPVALHLVTERPHNAVDPREPVNLAGFEVVGAVRQSGYIAVQVRDDWQVLWGDRNQVRQVELRQVENLPEDLWLDDVTATFEYFGQPYSLHARIVPRETRISVEPEYVVSVGSQSMQMEARFKYRVGGSKVFDLRVHLPGWEVDDLGSISPLNLVRIDDVVVSSTAPLAIPLTQPLTGEFELWVRAHRPVAPEADSVEFQLPRPEASVVAAATLVVQPDDNVELAPREAELAGLVRQRFRPETALPTRQQPPWVYRSDGESPRFAAGFRVHSRAITVDVQSRVTLAATGSMVEQQFDYQVAREPLDAVHLDVPAALAEAGQLRVLLGGRQLAWGRVGSDASDPVRVRVALPSARIGNFRLVADFPLTEEKPLPQTSVSVRIGLVMPGEGELAGNRVTVVAAPGIKARPLGGLWSRDTEGSAAGGSGLRLVSSVPRHEVTLGVQWDDTRRPGETVVDRAWLQSWFADNARHDRVVLCLLTREPQVRLQLPSGVSRDGVRALLDGRPLAASDEVPSAGELIVPLDPQATVPRRYRLELDYRLSDAQQRWSIDLPQLSGASRIQRLYWQVVLPADVHLVDAPAGLMPEHRWTWNGLFWTRRPQLDQAQLEAWTGAIHLADVPAGTNQYLFGGQQWPGRTELRVASRAALVLLSSGAVLAVGLLLIYVPLVRHPAMLLAGAVALLGLGAVYPETALVVAQAAGAGIALALVAGLLQRTVARRETRAVLMPNPASAAIDHGSTQTHRRPPMAAAPAASGTSSVSTTIGAQIPSAEGTP
jgi:hypothetical protein